jgi:hypothetical protein
MALSPWRTAAERRLGFFLWLVAASVHCGGQKTAAPADDGGAGAGGGALTTTTSSSTIGTGGGGVGGGAGGSVPTEEDACDTSLEATCKLFESCIPGDLETVWGDVASCKASGKPRCVANLHAPGIDDSPARVVACARATAGASCDDWLFSDSYDPPECHANPGKLADGSPCAIDAQCSGGYCQKPDHKPYNTLCGVCSRKAPLGGPCTTLWDCDHAFCRAGACVLLPKAGEGCSEANFCDGFLVCLGLSAASPTGTCGKPLGAGAACDPAFDACFLSGGLVCDASTKVCARRNVVLPGQPCGPLDECGGGAACGPDPSGTARCLPRTGMPRGAACAKTSDCAPNDACVRGTCSAFDPALCR